MTDHPTWLAPQTLPTEDTFDQFVQVFGGQKISDFLPKNPSFKNADYLFCEQGVIAELKTIKTDFGANELFLKKYFQLMEKYFSNEQMPSSTFFDSPQWPKEFLKEFRDLFRTPLKRILENANKQIKETKKELNLPNHQGILLLANDKFISLEPRFIISIISDILVHSYSSIGGFVYLTLNHYVEIPNNDYANLLWIPAYSEKSPHWLVDFVNDLGKQWFQFLEKETQPFDHKLVTDDGSCILQAKVISP
jgi:hypothetical protein